MGEENDFDSEHDSEKPLRARANRCLVATLWFHQHFMAPWNLFMSFSSIINPTSDGIYIFHPHMNFGIIFQRIGVILLSIPYENYLFIYKILSRY